MKDKFFLTALMAILVSVSEATAAAGIELKVSYRRGAGPTEKIELTIMGSGKDCELKTVAAKRKIKLSDKLCQQFYGEHKNVLLGALQGPAIHNDQSYFAQIDLETSGKSLHTMVEIPESALCDEKLRCQEPEDTPVTKMARALRDLARSLD